MDNATGHPSEVVDFKVKTKDGFNEAMYLPANMTALIQEMDQIVIKIIVTL